MKATTISADELEQITALAGKHAVVSDGGPSGVTSVPMAAQKAIDKNLRIIAMGDCVELNDAVVPESKTAK